MMKNNCSILEESSAAFHPGLKTTGQEELGIEGSCKRLAIRQKISHAFL